MTSTIVALATVVFLVLLDLKVRYENGQSLPKENHFLPTAPDSIDVIGDSPESNPSLLPDIYRVTSSDELMEIVEEYELEGEENGAFLIKALEFDDELSDEDWDTIYEAAEEGSELRQFADPRPT